MNEDDDELALLTVEQVMELLQMKKSWVYNEVAEGRLPAVRLGRRYLRFSRADIKVYLKGQRTVAGQ